MSLDSNRCAANCLFLLNIGCNEFGCVKIHVSKESIFFLCWEVLLLLLIV